MSLRLKATVVAGLVMVMTAVSAWATTPEKLVDTTADEYLPSIVDGWLGWSVVYRSKRDLVWLDPTGPVDAWKIRTPYNAYLGDVIVDGPRAGQAVFWQFEGENGQIRFVDLDSKNILSPPSGVNTTQSEEFASMSGDYLLFGRGPKNEPEPRQVMLYRFDTEKTLTVASASSPILLPDQVNGDFVVYTRITKAGADVYRYRVSTKSTMKVPAAPSGRANYYAGVLGDGSVFYVQGSATTCGKNTKILRLKDGKTTAVASIPDGIEISDLNAREIGGEVHVAFRRIVCATGKGGIYEIVL